MREIKFRRWSGPWSDGKYRMTYSGDLREEGNADNFTFDNGILMQYTGLRDKNGTEIYEGDIVRVTPTMVETLEPFIGVIEYRNGAFDCVRIDMSSLYLYPTISCDGVALEFEVIGNIYEHPHLLGGEEE
jgi:uncharacterized phage protein (TIGR01671 family)